LVTSDERRDDIDRVFAYLEGADPPADFVERVMMRARQSEAARWRPWQQALFAALYVAALAALAMLAYLTGGELENAHLRDLISLAVHDMSLVSDSPGVYLSAIRDAIPWVHVLAVVGDTALLFAATRLVLRAARPVHLSTGVAA